MINKLRRRVTIYTVAAVALVLALLLGGINLLNYMDMNRQADEILYYLAESGGDFPMKDDQGRRGGDPPPDERYSDDDDFDDDYDDDDRFDDDLFDDDRPFMPKNMTEETPFETRYFSVTLKDDGSVETINTGKIAAISSNEAVRMTEKAAAKGKTSGYDGNYKYLVYEMDGKNLYIFLDCTRDLETVKTFLLISILVAGLGLIAISLLVIALSPKMIRPITESYEKQKEFITNAGHELKTPLTVIESCAEVIEMQSGESKWTAGIKEQVSKLAGLTTHMVALAKMDEEEGRIAKEPLDLSKLVNETLEGFCLEAEHKGRVIDKKIDEGITMEGNPALLAELVSILADNALKYGSPDKPIQFSLSRKGKKIVLCEENYAEGLEQGSLDKYFDRFYRGDASHSSEKPGSGIGLSMARSIAEAHRGSITAESPDGERIVMTVTL